MRTAVFPGSFDPVTLGHLDIMERASDCFDKLIVAVMKNNGKNSFLDFDARIELLSQVIPARDNISVMSFDGLLADFVRINDACVIVRGLRDGKDLDYEIPLAQGNMKLYSKADTVFYVTRPEYSYISSSAVRELASYGADISDYVPGPVAEYINNRR
ncbi:MAG: pantetheine-phosphate adenylyltransferase [Lachnospiraceae bacterium]|jgi:pantetheine-phosphate adenylyltransferase|nr:pantetheine-phosphate adenylyltransferase [Lachnospiraceae bacterium]MEE3460883.1 pantetheine-phosphate adenylyltransferase [Lachnospiraceae bacterium]